MTNKYELALNRISTFLANNFGEEYAGDVVELRSVLEDPNAVVELPEGWVFHMINQRFTNNDPQKKWCVIVAQIPTIGMGQWQGYGETLRQASQNAKNMISTGELKE